MAEITETRWERPVGIRELKAFVHDMLPAKSPLRDLILTEPDVLPSSEFLVKCSVWLKLLRKM